MKSGGGLGLGEPQHRQHDGQHVLGAMVDLAGEQELALLGALAVGDVDGDAVHAHRLAVGVARDDAGAVAPAHLAARPHDAEFDLEARLAQARRCAVTEFLLAVVGMHHRLDALDRRLGMSPDRRRRCGRARRPIRCGRSSRSTSHEPMSPADSAMRAALLALAQALGLRLELGGARGDALLELGVQRLELAGLAVELDEDPDLGAQHLGHDRHGDVVDRADLVAAQMVDLGDLHAPRRR